MNIFLLDKNTKTNAAMHCDKHVVKMILEYAQLLSTAHHVLDGENVPEGLYRKTHANHPSAKWVRESNNNYTWLYCLFTDLCDEYTHRYSKTHATDKKLRKTLMSLPKNIPVGYLTPIPQCMPDEFKTDNPVDAYRNYYRGDKAYIAKWTKRPMPDWWNK